MTFPDPSPTRPLPAAGESVSPARRWPPMPGNARVLVLAAILGVFVSATVTWTLFGPDGPFAREWGFGGMMEYLNEVFGEGSNADEAGRYLLLLVLVVPAALGAVTRSGHWVWIAPLTFPAADFLLWLAAVLSGTPHPGFSTGSGLLLVLLYGLPAMAAAGAGVLLGKLGERLVRTLSGREPSAAGM
ncbi:MAG: hypothetical protein ACKOWF_06845 [Chloroflexota bacterium]